MTERPAGSFELRGRDGRSVGSARARAVVRWVLIGGLVLLLVALLILTVAPIVPVEGVDGS